MKKIIALLLLFVTIGFTNVFADTISVRVTSSKPIYKTVTVRNSYDYYRDVEVQVPYNCGVTTVNRNTIGLDTIIGTVAGVVIGNQIGHGNGRVVAKVAGGVGGAYIANQMRTNNSQTCYRTEIVQKKFTDYQYEEIPKIVAYKNCGYLGNRKICKKTKRKQRYIYLNY